MVQNQYELNVSFIASSQMIELPAGSISMRDDRTKQEWTMDVAPFYLAKYVVTQEFFRLVTNEAPSAFIGSQRPVETVSWKDAVLFCNSLSLFSGLTPCYQLFSDSELISFDVSANGYRLPSEAEWVYACKAGSIGVRYGDINAIAWYKDNSDKTTHYVGALQPNEWGFYDMLGNVWEWCNDIYDETVYGTYRIFKGGGWNDEERSVMATTRRRSHPIKFKIDDLGFRIARNKD